MYCRSCGRQISSTLTECPGCGAKWGGGDGYCQECGAPTEATACLCARCGCELAIILEDGTRPVSTFKEAVRRCFKRYFTFSGRANRVEFWMWMLFVLIATSFIVVGWIMLPVVIIPTFSVAVRRLHDVGKSGWWVILGLIPPITFYVIYLLACRGNVGDNSYGIAQE